MSDYNDLPTLNYLKNEKHFFKFLGDINELSHFEFNNRAYFSYNKEEFSNIFEKNTKNYNKLLKYVFTLKQISLKSSQEVVKNRFNFANYILNVCNELLDIIVKINISIKKRDGINKLIQNVEENKKCEYKQIKVSKSYQVPYEEIYKENLSHGWYALYCNNCNKICHRDCKGVNEGNHSNENGCHVMDILNDKCSYCNCHYQKHKFHDYIEKKRIVYRSEIYEAIEYDPKSISSEKEKEKEIEIINKEIESYEKKLKELDTTIHDTLYESLQKLFIIANKEKELNKIALKQYEKEKYGYCKKILDETIEDKSIKNIFSQTLDNIETIFSNDEQKENSINNLQKSLNSLL